MYVPGPPTPTPGLQPPPLPSLSIRPANTLQNNPLHSTILSPLRTPLQYSLLLSSTIDVFEMRRPAGPAQPSANLTGEYGLLHAVDDRLAAYGYETNTGVRFVVVVDVRTGESRSGLRDADLRPVCSLPFHLPPLHFCPHHHSSLGSQNDLLRSDTDLQSPPVSLHLPPPKPLLRPGRAHPAPRPRRQENHEPEIQR